jgi:F-type H+-transporting ATPase subunit delta
VSEISSNQARHYARALFNVTAQKGGDESTRLRVELRDFVSLLETNSALRNAVEHPAVVPKARGRALRAVSEGAGGSLLLGRLLGLLAEHGHVALLPALSEAFAQLVNAAEGVVPAQATGAIALTAEQEKGLAQALQKSTGSEVEMAARVDPRVLGGLQVTVGGKTYDGTVRGQLAALRRRLAAGS